MQVEAHGEASPERRRRSGRASDGVRRSAPPRSRRAIAMRHADSTDDELHLRPAPPSAECANRATEPDRSIDIEDDACGRYRRLIVDARRAHRRLLRPRPAPGRGVGFGAHVDRSRVLVAHPCPRPDEALRHVHGGRRRRLRRRAGRGVRVPRPERRRQDLDDADDRLHLAGRAPGRSRSSAWTRRPRGRRSAAGSGSCPRPTPSTRS